MIRVSKHRRDPYAVAYLVATSDKVEALELVRAKVGVPGDQIEDMGRVSEALITAMSLPPGQFMPINGVRDVRQQQQWPQFKTDTVQ